MKPITRREWLLSAAAAGVAGAGSAAGVAGAGSAAGPQPRMRLSLSVRIAEAPGSKEKTIMGFEDFAALAKKNGYPAICMRASQAGIHTPPERVREVRRIADRAGLKISMVTGDFAVPSNDENGPKGLRNITPYLDLAEALGADLIRVCMKKEEDIVWAQRAADQARERRIRLAHQSHHTSLFETVSGSMDTLKRVNRPNFGIIYEPANWFAAQQDYGPAAIRRIAPWLMNVYVQNHALNPKGKAVVPTWIRGNVAIEHIGLWEKGGVNFEQVFEGLYAVNYRGFIGVHQAFAEIMTPEQAALRSYQYLKPFLR